jgi:Ecdysteroid kinase-like family
MTDELAIPADLDGVTPEWLTQALASTLPDVEVTGVEVLARHSGTTGRARLGLTYAGRGSGPATVFVKLPPFEADQRRLVARTDMGRREARFYAGPAVEVPMRIPRAYHAAHGGPTEYIMVLEDLEAWGCTFSNRLETHAETHGEDLVESLGRLHARFWNDTRFDGELSWIQPAMRGSYGAKLVAMARDQFAAELPPVFDELCALFVEHHERIAEVWDEGERTLIHGDTHAGNQFIDGDQVGLYDWAVISRSPGVRDLAIYLGNSCPAEVRREHEDAWLRRYHQVLVESGVDAPEFGVLFDRYRRTVLYAWVAATTTAAMGSKWQPIEIGIAGMTRATECCADLDTLDALRASI